MRTMVVALLAALATLGACKNDGTGPSAAELTGTWEATTAGGSATLVLGAGSVCTLQMTIPSNPTWNFTGTWSASVDVLSLDLTGPFNPTWQFDMTLAGNTLTLAGADTDFAFNGSLEAAKLGFEWARQ